MDFSDLKAFSFELKLTGLFLLVVTTEYISAQCRIKKLKEEGRLANPLNPWFKLEPLWVRISRHFLFFFTLFLGLVGVALSELY